MKIGINNKYQIKQIGDITNEKLTVIELDETAENYPFKNWSKTKILCYCYKAENNCVSVYPYIDTNIVEKLETNAKELEITQGALNDLIMGVV